MCNQEPKKRIWTRARLIQELIQLEEIYGPATLVKLDCVLDWINPETVHRFSTHIDHLSDYVRTSNLTNMAKPWPRENR